jgi:hypothetical protein
MAALSTVSIAGFTVALGAGPAVAKNAPGAENVAARAVKTEPASTHPADNPRATTFCNETSTHICPAINHVWSGYVASPTENRQFASVSATWTEPTVKCVPAKPDAWTLFWTGLDGWSTYQFSTYGSKTVEQGGSTAQCLPGEPAQYYTWWEMYPTNDVTEAFPIAAGDQISTSVVYSWTDDTYTVTLDDSTSQESAVVVSATAVAPTNPNTYTVTTTVKGVSTTTGPTSFVTATDPTADLCGIDNACENASAEWVVEAPGDDGSPTTFYPLARFSPMIFKSARAVDSSGDTGSISDAAWTVSAVDLATSTGIFEASVTPLKKAGTRFRDVWDPGP